MKRGFGAVAAVTLVVAAGLAWGQAAKPSGEATTVRPVDIGAKADRRTIEHQVHAFVGAVSARHDGEALARWRLPICPLVAGTPPEQAEFVLQRFSEIAQSVGAPLDGRDCKPNLFIVFTDDSDKLLRLWRAHDRGLFGPGLPATINRFLAHPRPVRVWYNAYFAGADSVALSPDAEMYGGAPMARHAVDSRLQRTVVRNLQTAIVIVDAPRLKGVRYGALTDYIALVALSEANLDAPTGDAPTILRLFDAPPDKRPEGLTAWDRNFLVALHKADQATYLQRQQIADRMVDALSR